MKKRRISRSGHEALFQCPRRFYLGYEHLGTGLESSLQPLKFLIGNGAHKGLETAMRLAMLPGGRSLIDPVSCAEEGAREFARLTVPHRKAWDENPALLTSLEEAELIVWGLTYGWLKTELDRFLERFEVIRVEEEWETPISPDVILQSRVDVFVRERGTGLYYVINWKTSEKKDEEKLRKEYQYNSQMWLEAIAAEWQFNEPVQGTIPIVLYKGVQRYGTHSTALVYAYEKNGTFKPTYTAGWRKLRVDQLAGGQRAWIDGLPKEVLSEYFITLAPILKDKALVEEVLEETVYHEQQAKYVLENGSDNDKRLHFPRRTGYWCDWCPFEPECFKRTTIDEMVSEGLLVPRVDHHGEGEKKNE